LGQSDQSGIDRHGATQSSTYPTTRYSNHNAGIAIDGITDGNAYHGHITHTNLGPQEWWQVDLLGLYELDQIVLWNRTDSIGQIGIRLSNFDVSVIDDLGNVVWTQDFFTAYEGYPNPSLTIDLPDNTLGRTVKVSLNGVNYLSLAEVQVFGDPVPEPSVLLLFSSGLIGLVGLKRKFKG
jgi:hypothetical protein